MSRLRMFDWFLGCHLILCLSFKLAHSATLTVLFPATDLPPPGLGDVYSFVFTSPEGAIPGQFRFGFVATNYTSPIVIPNAVPTSFYNVTVFVNNRPLPTRTFFSGPDPPTKLTAVVMLPNTTVVSWYPPVTGGVQKYRLQLLTRDMAGNVTKGAPIDWPDTTLPITPLNPGGEYAVEVVSVYGTLSSDPVRTSFIQYPLPPRNLRSVPIFTNESAVTVQWEPPEGLVDSYYLSIASGTYSNETLLPARILSAGFQNLQPGETYQVAVMGVRGNWSSVPTVINTTTNPLPPTDIHEQAGSADARTLRIVWSPPLISSGSINYRATLNSSDTPPMNTSSGQATWTNLLPSSTYAASVESYVLGSDGPVFSKPARRIFHTGIDSTFVVNAVRSRPEIAVESTDASIHLMEANATSEDNLVANGETLDNRMVFRDLVGGTHYLIYVKTMRNDVEMIMPFDKLTYPLPPLNVSINANPITPESVLLEWVRPVNTRLQGYQVLYNKLDDSVTQPSNTTVVSVPDSTALKYNLTGLIAGAKYSFRMRSVIEDAQSVETEPLLQCTRPPKPIGVTVKAMSVKLLLQLTRPSNTTKYYRVGLTNIDLKGQPPRTMDIRNDSAIVQVPIQIDYLGAVYEVRVSSYMCDLQSEVVATVVNSLPPVVVFVRPPTEITQTSIKVAYQSMWPIGRSMFTRYAFQINGTPPKYVLPNGEPRTRAQVEFTDLIPGTKYVVSAWSERGEVQSDRKSLEVQLKPDNVTEMNATKITSRTIAFQWTPPNGTVSQYAIGYNNTEPVFTNSSSWIFTGLVPYTIYSVYVAAWSGTERSSSLTRFFTTLEDKPGRVRFFNLSALRPFKLLARWEAPEQPNGIITSYILNFRDSSSPDVDASWTHLTFSGNDTSHLLTLEPGKSYVLRIAPVNSMGIGPAQDGFMTMPLGAPVLSRTAARPTLVATSKNTITLQFQRDFFSTNNGDVVNYTVLVTEEPLQNLSRILPSWTDVHDLPVWPPYQALDYFNPFDGSNNTKAFVVPSTGVANSAQVILGNEQNCDSYRGTYCNGPLKENTRYYVKLRAFASMSQSNPLFTDTFYSEPLVTAAPTSNALGIILGICIPLVFIVLLGLGLAMMRMRSWGPFVKRAHKAAGKTAIEDKLSITESISEKSRPVRLKDFAEHVRIMTADSDFKFSEEYEDLKHVGRDQACVAADFPVNRAKNRFTNILPYDHSRVKLMPTDDEEGSDYINANYMPGFNSPREFIVTQGPLPSTRDDFWRMIWEQNCRAIVMLTRCVEKGREKCDHYWPYDTDAVVYGDVDVTVMNETQTHDWTLREFRVAKNDEPARSVRHFHFTGWPDFGVPERPQTLIKFVRAFRERIFTDVKPIVVHCSAGVGRSGTFIALDRLLQQTRIIDTVDIFGMVCEMRKERVWMVQTEQQYICIHQCLLCVMEGRENEVGQFDTGIHENPCYEISDDEGIVESGPF